MDKSAVYILITEAREPYAKVSIIAPPDYVGNIMPMCQDLSLIHI